jgi:hypothetical protein
VASKGLFSNESILDGVERAGLVAEQAEGHPVGRLLVAAEQLIHGMGFVPVARHASVRCREADLGCIHTGVAAEFAQDAVPYG